MMTRLALAVIAVAFAVVSTVPLQAAMPVPGAGNTVENSEVIEVAKKKKGKKKSSRQEARESAEKGTVPSRYRSSVPKEYHQYIPFAK